MLTQLPFVARQANAKRKALLPHRSRLIVDLRIRISRDSRKPWSFWTVLDHFGIRLIALDEEFDSALGAFPIANDVGSIADGATDCALHLVARTKQSIVLPGDAL